MCFEEAQTRKGEMKNGSKSEDGSQKIYDAIHESFYSKPENRELARKAMRAIFDPMMLPVFELMESDMAEAGKRFMQEVSGFADKVPEIPFEKLNGFILTAYPDKASAIKQSIRSFFASNGINVGWT